jgi:hypothetical protein
MYQIMHLQYMILQSSVYFNMFRHDRVIFREYTQSLKPIKVKLFYPVYFNSFYYNIKYITVLTVY